MYGNLIHTVYGVHTCNNNTGMYDTYKSCLFALWKGGKPLIIMY